MRKDEIYKIKLKKISTFRFNKEVASAFDDMVSRSVPLYKELQKLLAQLAVHFHNPDKIIYDLGCATGETLYEIAKKTGKAKVQMTGMDISPYMLKIAQDKCSDFPEINFLEVDSLKADIVNPGVVILTYVLHFFEIKKRKALLSKIFNSLETGGVALISEKIHCDKLEKDFIKLHDLFKIEHRYSKLEIKQKKKALEKSLTPLSYEENKKMIHDCGFQTVETFFQCLNFCGFIAIK